MARHILDRPGQLRGDAPVLTYARAAARWSPPEIPKAFVGLWRRSKGPYSPGSRMRAYLRIARQQDAV